MSAPGLPYWLDIPRPTFPQLSENVTTDVAIVGAGISGTKLAYYLSKHGLNSVIIECGRAGDGASGRNQGSICTGVGILYAKAIEQFKAACGADARKFARALWRLGVDNQKLARAQMLELGIECDYQQEGFHTLVRRDAPQAETLIERYRRDCDLLREDRFDVVWMDEREAFERGGSPLYIGGLSYAADAQFHSGKYVIGLASAVARLKLVKLFEQTRVIRVEAKGSRASVITPRGVISAAHVFLATNVLVPQHVPSLADGLRAERGQAFVTEPLPSRPCIGSFGTHMAWWREIPQADGRFRLLFGGGRGQDEPDSLFRQFDSAGKAHPKLETEGSSPSESHQKRLDRQFEKLFPSLASVPRTHRWGGLQCFTADHLPMIGVFDPSRRIHGMAGFSGRGNTYTDVGAEVLAARVASATSAMEMKYGPLIDTLMKVGRPSAKWKPWTTSND
jgi:gamma-glutamylputrescine oxidase